MNLPIAPAQHTARTPEVRPLSRMRTITTWVVVVTVSAVGVATVLDTTGPGWFVVPVVICLALAVWMASRWHDPPRPRFLIAAVVLAEVVWAVGVLVGAQPTVVLPLAVVGAVAATAWQGNRLRATAGVVGLAVGTALLRTVAGEGDTGPYVVVAVVYSAIFIATFWLNDVAWRLFTEMDTMRRHEAELAVIKERVRFASDLHDIQGHTLHVIKLKAAVAARLQHTDPVRVAQELADIERLTGETIEQAQQLVNSTRELSFASELSNATALLDATGIHVMTDTAAGAPERSEEAALVLREGTTNILRHPRATTATIVTTPTTLVITNDGAGPGRPLRGLARLQERVAASGGRLTIEHSGARFTLALATGEDAS